VARQQRLGLADVRRLARGERQLDRVPEPVETAVNLGPEAAPAAAQRLIVLAASPVPFFLTLRRKGGPG
jgi:hypothetical protein